VSLGFPYPVNSPAHCFFMRSMSRTPTPEHCPGNVLLRCARWAARRLVELPAVLALVALLALVTLPSGCRTLSSGGPVSQSVTMGRQLTQQANNAMERGDWRRAESLLERAVQTSPADVDARRSYVEALWHKGARQEALTQLEEARKLAPEDPQLAVRTGEVQLALGQTVMAQGLADEALKLDPKCATAWALRGRVAAARGQHRQALADFQRSLGYAADQNDVTIQLAETYRQLNQPAQALVALETLADSYPPGDAPQQVLYLEGLALKALDRQDDAARMLARAAQLDRPSADLLYHLASLRRPVVSPHPHNRHDRTGLAGASGN
jgi:Tfp pilus assembly protein PilF